VQHGKGEFASTINGSIFKISETYPIQNGKGKIRLSFTHNGKTADLDYGDIYFINYIYDYNK
jgi:hypothetical protein